MIKQETHKNEKERPEEEEKNLNVFIKGQTITFSGRAFREQHC
jgi:hypothetical protein